MKKIFTLFAALAMVMSMSAQTLYLRGDFNSWGTTNKLDADGNCTIELKVGNYGFKVADANWSNYNFGSSATISETTTGVKFTKDSQDNCTLKATTAGVYTFKFNLSTLTLDVTYPQGEVVEIAPTVALAGSFNGWNTTANTLTNDSENLTATTTLNLAVGPHEFKVVEDGAWRGDGQTISRNNNSQAFETVNGSNNCTLSADVAGDYVFTWTFETNTLVVTYPEAGTDPETPVEPEKPEVTYVLMGVAADWTTGIAMTQNPDDANEYVLLGQEIAEGDAVKVVTLTNGEQTAWCGNVDEYSVAHSADDMGNIVLAPGKYDFYYKVTENIVYIGATLSEEPEDPEEPTYEFYEDVITNLVIDYDNMLLIGGPSEGFQVEVVLGLGDYDSNTDAFQLLPASTISVLGSEATFIDGVASVDGIDQTATAIVHCTWNSMALEFHLTMSATPMEATVVVVENAAIEIEKFIIFGNTYDYSLKMTGVWTNEGVDYPVLVEVPVYYPEATEASTIFSTVTVGDLVDENGPWLGFGEGDLTIETVDGVVTATGVVQNPMVGIAIDITISGTLPQGPTSVENNAINVKAVKVIRDGQLIIRNNGVEYNAQGAQL